MYNKNYNSTDAKANCSSSKKNLCPQSKNKKKVYKKVNLFFLSVEQEK